MNTDKMMVALDEFIHVGGGLILIIAAVSILTGLIREFVPQDKLQAKLTKHDKWGSLLGASFGMLTPFCSAAVVPVTMGMATMGTSLGTILSFLISAPLCNFIVLAMIYAAFGFKVTAIYLALTFSAAVIGGWLISKSPWKNEVRRGDELELATNGKSCSSDCSSDSAAILHTTNSDKFKNVLKFAVSLFKRIIPYVLLGALISGLSAAYLPAELVEKYVGGGDLKSIIIAALIGIPLYLRIEMAIPLLNVLILKGMGMGPALALIIGGTGASLPEIALVSSVLKRKAVLAFVLIILTTAVTGGVIFQYIM
ncbi:permease [Pseudoalteromonas sp. LC2018020214]|uniref:permease n=1 Tax=Pseudoalteromonas sp. LC2018020214 TaxID=2799564 RepID=UPI001F372F17|nr:permease [Pseudoalteromonas sp. LC2018020214]